MQLRQKALQGDARALDSLITLAARFNNDAGAPAQTLGADDQAILDYYAAEIAVQFKPPGEPRDDRAANLDTGELPKLDPYSLEATRFCHATPPAMIIISAPSPVDGLNGGGLHGFHFTGMTASGVPLQLRTR